MPTASGQVEITITVKCPKCGHEWDETQPDVEVEVEFELDDYAPDYP